MGTIHWGRAERLSTKQSSYYDHTFLKVPFTGTFDSAKVHAALRKRLCRPSYGKFGGGTSLGEVTLLDDCHLSVELIYHIGD